MDALKTEVFENDYFTVLDTSTSHVPVKDGTVFNQYYVFAQTGNNDSKTQRVDSDFLKNGAKISVFKQTLQNRIRMDGTFS